jgi:polysaccharide biosynthesis protein PslH
MKILFITPRIPYPLTDGGAIATYNNLKFLHAAGHDITLVCLNTSKHHQAPEVMREVCQSIRTHDINTDLHPVKAAWNLAFSRLPYSAERFVSEEFVQLVVQTALDGAFEVIHVESVYVGYCIEPLRAAYRDAYSAAGETETELKTSSCPPIVLRTHNAEYLIRERLARNIVNPFTRAYMRLLAERTKRLEARVLASCDGVFAITAEDAALLRSLGYDGALHVMPAGVDSTVFAPSESFTPVEGANHNNNQNINRASIFFFGGMDWQPNIEAVHWWMNAVQPLLQAALAAGRFASAGIDVVELHIGGKNPSPAILRYATHDATHDDATSNAACPVFVHPNVPSAPAFMAQYDVMIVPLLSGGGMRLKIVEGMSMAKAIVSTRIGAEGIQTRHRENIMLADTPEALLDAVVEVLTDAALRATLEKNARTTAVEGYSWRAIVEDSVEFYRQLVKRGARTARAVKAV